MTTPRFYDAGGMVTAAGRIRRVVLPTCWVAPFPVPDQETRCVSRSASTARSSRDAVLTTPSSPEALQRPAPGLAVRGDDLLVGRARAPQSSMRAATSPICSSVASGLARTLPSSRRPASSHSPPGQGQQHCALALAQIVPGRLAGGLWRAEDSQIVVAQLEGDADVLAEGGQVLGSGPARVQSGQEGADEQWVAHRVAS